MASGLLAIAVVSLHLSPHLDLHAAVAAVVVGAVAWFMPWERWPWWYSLYVVGLGFAVLGIGHYYGTAPYTAPFFVMIFAWVGLGYGRWISLWMLPFAAICYVVPILLSPQYVPGEASSAALTLPISLLVGESMGWTSNALRRTQRALVESERRTADALERERASADQLRALDEMKNTFLQAVSHELRTPLTVILGNALTLEQMDGQLRPEERVDLAGRTAANARKLEKLLSDLLDLDRLQRGIVLTNRQPTDIAAMARTVAEGSTSFAGRAVQLDVHPVVADVDPAKVERIMENLLSNAMKYTPDHTPVRLSVAERDGGVLIAVDDRGPGIPDELKTTIFQPFQRGDQVHSNAPGTGIGLALVIRFSELHGGRAWVEDRAGGGSSFRVFLPGSATNDDAEGDIQQQAIA
jgi:signal transduction histidine kinase